MSTQKLFRRVFVAVIALAIAVLPNAAWAAPGDPDTSFDGDGFQTLNLPGSQNDEAYAVLQLSNGRIVLGGETGSGGPDDAAVARFRGNGELDTSFSGDGSFTLDIRGVGGDDRIEELAQQDDGKLLAFGWAENADGSSSHMAILRFRANGTLDPTFSGDGLLLVKFRGYTGAFGYVGAVQDDGGILIAGQVGTIGSETDWDFAIARITAGGRLDGTFGGGDGRAVTNFSGDDGIQAMAIQSDGKALVGGWAHNPGQDNYRSAFARYRTNGTLDPTFSGDGKKILDVSDVNDEVDGIGIRGDGKSVAISGVGGDPLALIRLTTRGKADPTFHGDGFLIVDPVPAGLGDADLDLAGKKLIVTAETFDNQIFVARYKPNGDLDTGFGGGDGFILATFPGASQSSPNASALQSNGRILTAGFAQIGSQDFGVARFLP